MINSNHVPTLCALSAELAFLEIVGDMAAGPPLPERIAAVHHWLRLAGEAASEFQMGGVQERIRVFKRGLDQMDSLGQIGTEARVLREALDYEIRQQFFYRYDLDKAAILLKWPKEWALTLKSFPSTESDIAASVDLWAMDHPTASVFHLMRVLEYGLRAMADDVGRPFEVQNWQNILDQIESEVRSQGKSLPSGLAKSERLRFLSVAAKEFHFFKDGWRNYVAHNRATYDEYQARTVMEHVRSFMNGLAIQLSESPQP